MAYLTTSPLSGQRLAYLEQRARQAGLPAAPDLGRQPDAAQAGCGALVSFVGIVRPDRDARHRQVRALFYEAYAEMAERQMQRLIDEARARWWLAAVEVQHRLGLIDAGQISVVVMTAAPHRAEAYAASQFLIEQIKQDVPIWKRELYDDGTAQWVTCAPLTLTVEDPQGTVHAHV